MYDVKPDLQFKVCLMCEGSRVDLKGISTRAIVVKGISVRLLELITDTQNLDVLVGDIDNAFTQAKTKEKMYTRLCKKSGDRAHCIALIKRAIYGLTTGAERFHTLLADFLRTFDFNPTKFNRDV